MADPARRLRGNAAGPLFVDATCIDCDACRRLAPATFGEDAEKSVVVAQPDDATLPAALRALVTCPVGAIGDLAHRPLAAAIAAFPQRVDGPVWISVSRPGTRTAPQATCCSIPAGTG